VNVKTLSVPLFFVTGKGPLCTKDDSNLLSNIDQSALMPHRFRAYSVPRRASSSFLINVDVRARDQKKGEA
jgi:hypothetical protein